MAAAIMHGGIDGSGETLFQGKKIFVAQRVPLRSSWIDQVKANGGEIVQIEKLADVVIADHLHKHAPPGSYSWKWIEQSVKAGVLQDLEQFPAGPTQGSSRPIGSSQPTRATRTAFTDADDRALALWVARAEMQGFSMKGNAIYQQLEKANPRHTYQSWRDRWVKYGQFKPRPTLNDSDRAAGTVIERRPPRQSRKSLSVVPNTRNSPLSSGHRKSTLSEAAPSSSSAGPPTKLLQDQPFTEKDGEILLEVFDDIMNMDEARTVEAWEHFAIANPQHTAIEWQNFWTKHIRPLRSIGYQESIETASPLITADSQRDGSLVVSETGEKQTIASVTRAGKERKSRKWPMTLSAESRFEHTLRAYAEARDEETEFYPTIDGQKIRLFDLWKLVNKREFRSRRMDDAQNNIWLEIASRLGFDNQANPNASRELKEIGEGILTGFADVRRNFRASARHSLGSGKKIPEQVVADLGFIPPLGYDDEEFIEPNSDEGEDEQEMELERATDEEQDEEHLEIPSSPPERIWPASAKRDQQGVGRFAPAIITPQKRSRAQEGGHRVLEVPSTPEDRLAFQAQASESWPIEEQTLRPAQAAAQMDLSEEESMFIESPKRNIFAEEKSKPYDKPPIEPETQEFYFSNTVDDGSDALVSQQLLDDVLAAAESMAAVAGPPHGDSLAQSQTDSQRDEIELRAFVDHHIALGYPEDVVTHALLATTLETGDAATVMEFILQGGEIPQNIEGVWTAADDKAVALVERGEEYGRIVAKHGEVRCVKRRQFLSDAAFALETG